MRALRRAMAASGDGGALEIVGTAADPRLAAHVRSYHGFRETTRGPMRRRELPGGRLVLMVELGPPIRFLDRAGGADRAAHPQGFLAGLHTAPVLTETAGAQSGVQVMLTPLGARRLLGLPMADLTDRVVALPDVLGAEGAVLAARLREATGWAARFDAMDAFLLRRLAAAREVPAGIAWACRTLEATAERTPIARLAAELGRSQWHLIAGFRAEIGMPPKHYARLLRFERAFAALAAGGRAAAVAQDCGYADRAHMIRDFRAFAAATPGEVLRARLPSEGGLVA